MSRVTSSSSSGTVSIQDSAGNPIIATDGALNVTTLPVGTPLQLYGEAVNIAMGASETVLTYTVPSGNVLVLLGVSSSSDSIGIVEIDVNGSTSDKKRFSFCSYNVSFDYTGLYLIAGTTITVTSTNSSMLGSSSANASLQGILK